MYSLPSLYRFRLTFFLVFLQKITPKCLPLVWVIVILGLRVRRPSGVRVQKRDPTCEWHFGLSSSSSSFLSLTHFDSLSYHFRFDFLFFQLRFHFDQFDRLVCHYLSRDLCDLLALSYIGFELNFVAYWNIASFHFFFPNSQSGFFAVILLIVLIVFIAFFPTMVIPINDRTEERKNVCSELTHWLKWRKTSLFSDFKLILVLGET